MRVSIRSRDHKMEVATTLHCSKVRMRVGVGVYLDISFELGMNYSYWCTGKPYDLFF